MNEPFLKRVNRTALICGVVLAIIFVGMLYLNMKTPYLADDFVYLFSFATKQRLASLGDIIPSMYVHSLRMNGRVISHGLMQLFSLAPIWLFDLCNAAVFCYVFYQMMRYALAARSTATTRQHSAALLLAGFACLWSFTPVFGQAVLWQVGALNYLCGVAALLFFVKPFFYAYLGCDYSWNIAQKLLFTLAALLIGMYTEVSSFVAIALGALLLLAARLLLRQKTPRWLFAPLLAAALGYLCLMLIPAERAAKQDSLTLPLLWKNFLHLSYLALTRFWPLLLAWVLLLMLSLVHKKPKEQIILSCILVVGAGIGGYMLMAASYIPLRCLCPVPALLAVACAILLPRIEQARLWQFCRIGFVLLLGLSSFRLYTGVSDILACSRQVVQRERQLFEGKAQRQTDFVLLCVTPQTEYSAFYQLRDMSTTDADDWPNSSMAKYYGVGSILGQYA